MLIKIIILYKNNNKINYLIKYKTEMCKYVRKVTILEYNGCPFKNKCIFAHNIDELIDFKKNNNYKTINCNSFHNNGYCMYGTRCMFKHYNYNKSNSLNRLLNLKYIFL